MISEQTRIFFSSFNRITKRKIECDLDSSIFEIGAISAQEMVYLLIDLYNQGYLNRDDIINIAKQDKLTPASIIQLIHLKRIFNE